MILFNIITGLVVFFLILLFICEIFLQTNKSNLIDFYTKGKEKKLEQKAEKQKLKLEKNKQNRKDIAENLELTSSKEDEFKEFKEFVQKQLEKFSLYSCQDDKDLQSLLEKTYWSISRLANNLSSDNYTNQEIYHFYKFELEQFFILLGDGPNFTVDKKLYERLCDCLKAINNKATKLEKNIKEWQNFLISVKLEALIEYIKK